MITLECHPIILKIPIMQYCKYSFIYLCLSRSHFELKVSDHKPVSAIFDSGMKVVDQVKYRKIYEDVMKRLDKLENEFLPQVTVDTTEIVFDTIKRALPSHVDEIMVLIYQQNAF